MTHVASTRGIYYNVLCILSTSTDHDASERVRDARRDHTLPRDANWGPHDTAGDGKPGGARRPLHNFKTKKKRKQETIACAIRPRPYGTMLVFFPLHSLATTGKSAKAICTYSNSNRNKMTLGPIYLNLVWIQQRSTPLPCEHLQWPPLLPDTDQTIIDHHHRPSSRWRHLPAPHGMNAFHVSRLDLQPNNLILQRL